MALDSKAAFLTAALSRLGEPPYQSDPSTPDDPNDPDENDDLSVAASSIYESARDFFLYSYPWSWALERSRLREAGPERGPADDTPVSEHDTLRSGYQYAWSYPNALIGNLRGVYDSGDRSAVAVTEGWTRRGNLLYSDFSPVWAEYIRDVGEAAYPAMFRQAFILLLCSELSMFITQDENIAGAWMRKHEDAARKAEKVDSQAKPATRTRRHRLVTARLRGIGPRIGV